MAKKQEGTIVEASMSAGASARLGGGLALRGKDFEDAMSQAVEDALAAGITDSEEILALKLAARDRVKKEHAAAVAARARREEARAAEKAKEG